MYIGSCTRLNRMWVRMQFTPYVRALSNAFAISCRGTSPSYSIILFHVIANLYMGGVCVQTTPYIGIRFRGNAFTVSDLDCHICRFVF